MPVKNTAAIAYVRVSTEEQAREGISLAAQEERARAYCLVNGLTLAAILREEGVSAKTPLKRRPEGAKLATLMRRHKASNIIALKLDRLFRNTIDALRTVEAWDKADIAVHIVDMAGQPINTKSAIGRLFLTMLAGFAEFERELISERTLAAMAHKKRLHEYVGAVPLGFDLDGVHLVPNLEELAVVGRILRRRASGATLQQIADDLNIDRIPTKNGRRWHPSTISYLLRNQEMYYQTITNAKTAPGVP